MGLSWIFIMGTLCSSLLRDLSAEAIEDLNFFSTCTIDANRNCSAERPRKYPVILTVGEREGSCIDLFSNTSIIDFSCETIFPGEFYHNIMDCLLPLFGLVEHTRILSTQSKDYQPVLVSPSYLKGYMGFFLPVKVHFYYERNSRPCFTTSGTSVSYVKTDKLPVATKIVLAERLRRAGTYLSAVHLQVIPSILIIEREGHSRKFQNSSRIFDVFSQAFPKYELLSYHGRETIRETIALFARATIVFGYHGAGHVNCIFSQPGTIVVELTTFKDVEETETWRSNRVIQDYHTQLKLVRYHLDLDKIVTDMDEFNKTKDKDHYIKDRIYVDVPIKALMNIIDFIKAMQ